MNLFVFAVCDIGVYQIVKMVILAVSIISKSGKALVSRQFVTMSRIRVEGYLAAFPKLIGSGKQHTYVETDNVRYVYQPIESLFLIILTSKQSNILEDLETLRILSKLVPEYAPYLDEDEISHNAFELIFAFDEVISLGHRENITVSQVKQYCEMESQEEKLHKIMLQNKINETKDIMKRKASEIGKKKVERTRSGKVLLSLQSMSSGSFERTLSDLGLSSSNGVSGSGSADMDSLISKPKAATGPSKGRGMQLGKTQRTNQFLQSLKAEGEEIIEDVRPSSIKSAVAVSPVTVPVMLNVEEKLSVTLKRDGGLANFDVQGTLSLQILEEKDAYLHVQVESKNDPRVVFKTHPNVNKELFSTENILGLKDENRPFPTGQSGDGVGLLKWRMQCTDESVVPITINCWPSVSGNETDVSIEYEASSTFDMKNVIILVPLPSLREPPNVRHIHGEWRYDPRNAVFEWSILFIDNSNRSGSVEFTVPTTDPSAFYPISVQFTAIDTFSGLKVANVIPLKGGSQPNFAQRSHLFTENYRVV
ncbi:coatomer subunit delta-like isoform X2 [Silene latifolia]|uniref:coatomer subunit delta-like isoform X2 n=1 Tax=Silene latifolia TaxID=37657 RepID=UPI003D77F5E3